MRIGISGCQNNGKSTLVSAMTKIWPMYKTPERTYRDIIKEQNLSINENSNVNTQRIIRDALVDQAQLTASEKYSIADRIIIDNLIFTFWLADKNKLGTDSEVIDFLTSSIIITRETVKLYDVIFYLPLNPNIILEEKEQRSIDPVFREEVDNILYSLFQTYKQSEGTYFPKEDCPAIIELVGDLQEKIDTIKEYLNPNGDLVETDSSVFDEINNLDISEETLKSLGTV